MDTNDIIANRGDILFESELLNEVNDKIDFYIFPNPDCLFFVADTKNFCQIKGGNFKQLMTQTSIINTLKMLEFLEI